MNEQPAQEVTPSEETDKNVLASLGDAVTLLRSGEREIYLVGTAHVSKRSVKDVEEVIRAVRPDTVCVELDEARRDALVNESAYLKLNIFDVIRQRKVLFVLSSLVLSAYQRRIGEAVGVKPGAEMLKAIECAEAQGATLVLADRDIQATLKRTWRSLSLLNKAKVIGALVNGFFSANELTESDIEKLKERDHLSDAMDEFARVMPQVKKPLIDERDEYLIGSVERAPGKRIVAVVGAGHVEGMKRRLGEEADLKSLTHIPEPPLTSRLLPWMIPAVVLCAFYAGYQNHQGEGLKHMLYAWVLPNSIMAGLLGVIAGAKPLTILTAFISSPITSLNPTVGTGMVTGMMEAWLRKPTIADCQAMKRDSETVSGIYRNRFTRVLLVAVLTTIGSGLGGWIGATWVVTLL